MSVKFGECPLCPPKSPQKRLYGSGVCSYHLAHPEDDQSKKKADKEATDPSEQKLLNQFFREQASQRPKYCENQCGHLLVGVATWQLKSQVCHILEKRHFKSVIVHPLNRWFGCLDCHTEYDTQGWAHARTMKVWPVCVERYQQFMHLIKDTELRFLPPELREMLGR